MRKDETVKVAMAEQVRSRLRQLRTERGMSAQELVDKMAADYGLQMTRSAYSNFENGYRDDITFSEAVIFAFVLDVELVDLLIDPHGEGVAIGRHTWDPQRVRMYLGSAKAAHLSDDEKDALVIVDDLLRRQFGPFERRKKGTA